MLADIAWRLAISTVLLPLLYVAGYGFYNIFLHPLAKFPGPFMWRLTRATYMRSMMSGWLHRDLVDMHTQYGDIVRIAPDELSFTNPEAWDDIYTHKNGSPPFAKSKVWFSPPKNRAMSLLTALDPKDHARIHRALAPGFSEAAVLRQEPIIRGYVETLISKLSDLTSKKTSDPVVDIVTWYNYIMFDIIGDLGFGESFHCLEKDEYHPWMSIIFNSFRFAALFASLNFYPSLAWFTSLFIPASVKKKAAEHHQYVLDKVERRLNFEQERPDLMSLIEKNFDKKTGEGLPRPEIEANAQIFVTAGSETTATVISGITNHLMKHPEVLARLTREIREACPESTDVTLTKLKGLPFLNAVLQEGFRMCNPTPIGIPHVVPRGGAKVCGVDLPENTFVNACPIAMSYLPKHFYKAGDFCPERWLPESQNDPSSPFHKDARHCVHVFGIGQRACIGQNLARAELRMVLANLVWAFDLKPVESAAGKQQWKDQRSFFVTEKRPLEVGLHLR